MSDFEMLSIVLMILSIVVTILIAYIKKGSCALSVNCSPSSRQLKKYKFFLPVEIICWQFYAACK